MIMLTYERVCWYSCTAVDHAKGAARPLFQQGLRNFDRVPKDRSEGGHGANEMISLRRESKVYVTVSAYAACNEAAWCMLGLTLLV